MNRGICVWEPGPVLIDGIREKLLEGRRDSGLDVVSSRIAKSCYYERPLNARPRQYGGEYSLGYGR